MSSGAVYAQGVSTPWIQLLDWHTDQIDQVAAPASMAGRKISIEAKDCVAGKTLLFSVRDEYAFDIDETVWLDVDLYVASADLKVSVGYERDTGPSSLPLVKADPPTSSKVGHGYRYRQRIPLEHARFANLGLNGSDFSISSTDELAVCNVALQRSYTTPVRKDFGWAAIEVLDENGQPTPARMAIYDASGRLPLPSDEAVTFRNFLNGAGVSRVVWLPEPDRPFWPVKNRYVLYTEGRYHTRLPAGDYELIVAKGPEYRVVRQRFTLGINQTKPIKVRMSRWIDMAAKGWYSGDSHIHYARNSAQDDRTLQTLIRAEGINVANILELDNSVTTKLVHYDWKPVKPDEAPFVLVPSQEAPRTTFLGHSLELNIKRPIRETGHYLLYHKVFEQVRAQGGLTGYAHVSDKTRLGFKGARGLAIDMPFGLVDFAEILSLEGTGTSIWFDFLNLGYKLPPAAGADCPPGVPGIERTYVHVGDRFTTQGWFDNLKNGRTFVTNGPMLELTVNGQSIGSEIHVRRGEPLLIEAKGAINPDLDSLSSLDLIEQGDAIKVVSSSGGGPKLQLRHEILAREGTWFIVRARGRRPGTVALSGPIYVFVDGQRFWKRSAVPTIVAKLKGRMQEVFTPGQQETTEGWETQERFDQYWHAQQSALRKRVEQASALYDDLVRRAAASHQP